MQEGVLVVLRSVARQCGSVRGHRHHVRVEVAHDPLAVFGEVIIGARELLAVVPCVHLTGRCEPLGVLVQLGRVDVLDHGTEWLVAPRSGCGVWGGRGSGGGHRLCERLIDPCLGPLGLPVDARRERGPLLAELADGGVEVPRVDIIEGTAPLEQADRHLVLVRWAEAGGPDLWSHLAPCGAGDLVLAGRGARAICGAQANDVRVGREVSDLLPAPHDGVIARPFGLAEEVEELGAVLACGVVRKLSERGGQVIPLDVFCHLVVAAVDPVLRHVILVT